MAKRLRKQPIKTNKKGNRVLSREEYLDLINQDKESGRIVDLDPESIDPEIFDSYDVERGSYEGLDNVTRMEMMDYFEKNPVAKTAKYVLGKANDKRPEQAGVGMIANVGYGDYSDYAEDVPDKLTPLPVSLGTNISLPKLEGYKEPVANKPVRKSRKLSAPSGGKNKVQGYDYKGNRSAKGSLGRRIGRRR